MKKTAKKIGATVVSMATMDNLFKAIKSEVGQGFARKLYGNVFNIGPQDEAILDNAIGEISNNPRTRKRIRLMMDRFLKDMKSNDYSTEWFKAVMVKKNKDWKPGMKGKSPAARMILDIEQGADFEEKVKIATPELIHKTFKSKFKEGKFKDGWQVVSDNTGKLKLLIDPRKLPGFIAKEAGNLKEGFSEPLVSNKIISKTLIVCGIIVLALVAFIFGTV